MISLNPDFTVAFHGSQTSAMDAGGGFGLARWEDLMTLDPDLLVRILQQFDIFFDSIHAIYDLVEAWRRPSNDPELGETLDFSKLKSHYIGTKVEPFVYVTVASDLALMRFLNISLSLAHGNLKTLIFHYDLFLNDDQLTYIATRSARLRRLVLPAWNKIKRRGICEAIRGWRELESLTMPSVQSPQYLLREISRHCNKFRELKVMGRFDISFASSLATLLPKLKVLSLRCSMLYIDALIHILDTMDHLEVLNISHCLLVESLPPPRDHLYKVIGRIDPSIHKKASRVRFLSNLRFLTCMNDTCIMCQRTREDSGLPRWHRYEPGIWKNDEVSSLAL